jgi:hypothetical protein
MEFGRREEGKFGSNGSAMGPRWTAGERDGLGPMLAAGITGGTPVRVPEKWGGHDVNDAGDSWIVSTTGRKIDSYGWLLMAWWNRHIRQERCVLFGPMEDIVGVHSMSTVETGITFLSGSGRQFVYLVTVFDSHSSLDCL